MICKLPTQGEILRDLRCFILTMWYVNLNLGKTCGSFNLRFILTMWYVNIINWGYSVNGYFGFYINYVICKFYFNKF